MSAPNPLRDYVAIAAGNPPLLVDKDNLGWVATADSATAHGWYFYQGLRLAHWVMPEACGVAIHVLGGIEDDPRYETDGLLCNLSRDGLQALIRDLQAIDASLGDACLEESE